MRAMLIQKSPMIALVGWCVALLGVRVWYSGGPGNSYLFWNLLLALVPFAAALVLRILAPRRGLIVPKAVALGLWLAFLPNAPYLVTDFVHLSHEAPVPLWFDVALFGSCAATGALLGYAAVADVECVLAAAFGKRVAAIVAFGSLLLCGYGIYLGRFLRWNSWDVVGSPGTLVHQIAREFAHPLAHTATWGVSAVYGLGLVLGYVALQSIAPALASSAASR